MQHVGHDMQLPAQCADSMIRTATPAKHLQAMFCNNRCACFCCRGFSAQIVCEPPYMSKAALGQLAKIQSLTR
jgi:hypothetical protein